MWYELRQLDRGHFRRRREESIERGFRGLVHLRERSVMLSCLFALLLGEFVVEIFASYDFLFSRRKPHVDLGPVESRIRFKGFNHLANYFVLGVDAITH